MFVAQFSQNRPGIVGSMVYQYKSHDDTMELSTIPTLIGHHVSSLRIPKPAYVHPSVPVFTTQSLDRMITEPEYHIIIESHAGKPGLLYTIDTFKNKQGVTVGEYLRDTTIREFASKAKRETLKKFFEYVWLLDLAPKFAEKVQVDDEGPYITADYTTEISGVRDDSLWFFNSVVLKDGFQKKDKQYYFSSIIEPSPFIITKPTNDMRVFVPIQ